MKKKIAGLVIIFLTAGCIGAAGFWQERNRKGRYREFGGTITGNSGRYGKNR